MKISERRVNGYERVVVGADEAAGYHGIVVIHSTVLGPAVGGTRFWNYTTEEEAVTDALRLAKAMTYKNSLAGLPFGGGKSVIIGDNKTKERERIFRAHGKLIESLGGNYIAGEDVGTSPADIEIAALETRHVAGRRDLSGDPSPVTARGVFRAMQASAKYRWGSEDLSGRTVALQGCGHVGHYLAERLHKAGVKLIVSDVDQQKLATVVREFSARAVDPEKIYGVEADIFSPCALGGILNDHTIPQLQVEMVVGGANNQLLDPRHGNALEERNILYAPDYAANAGGITNGAIELLSWDREYTFNQVDNIYHTILRIFEIARADGIPTYQAADRLAERRIEQAKSPVRSKQTL
jgi:leucine dehydrogenase